MLSVAYAECRYADRCCAECRGTNLTTTIKLFCLLIAASGKRLAWQNFSKYNFKAGIQLGTFLASFET